MTWPIVPLSSLATLGSGYAFKSASWQDAGIPVVKITNVKSGEVRLQGCGRVSSETVIGLDRYKLSEGDLLITMTGDVGDVGVVREDAVGAYLNQRVGRFKIFSADLNIEFLRYFLQQPNVRKTMQAVAYGAAQPNISPSLILKHELPLPPLPTQRKIAAILSAYDDLIENNTRRVRVLEDMARALYREWFVEYRYPGHETAEFIEDEQGRRPKAWEWGRLDDCLVLQRGFDLPTKQRLEGPYPIFASTGINGYHNEKRVSGPGVVTGRSGSLGTVMLVLEDFWPLNTTLWVKEFKYVQAVYAYHLLSSLKLAQYNAGAAVPTLNRNDIHGLKVILPPQPLLQSFEDFAMTLYQQVEVLRQRNDNLRRTRDLLLPRLVSGELDVSGLDIRGAAEDVAAEAEAVA